MFEHVTSHIVTKVIADAFGIAEAGSDVIACSILFKVNAMVGKMEIDFYQSVHFDGDTHDIRSYGILDSASDDDAIAAFNEQHRRFKRLSNDRNTTQEDNVLF